MRNQPAASPPSSPLRRNNTQCTGLTRLVASALSSALALFAACPASAQDIGNRASELTPGSFHDSPARPTAPTPAGTPPPAVTIGGGNTAGNDHGPTGSLSGPAGPPPGEITGPIGPTDAARVMQSQIDRLRPCYDRARATRPTLAGRIEMRVTINRVGSVTQASADGMPDAPDVAPCIAAALRGLSFPRPEGNTLTLIHPITFVPPPAPPRAAPARGRGAVSPQRATQPSTAQRARHSPAPLASAASSH